MAECGFFGTLVHENVLTKVIQDIARRAMFVPNDDIDMFIEQKETGLPLDSVKFIMHIFLAIPLGVVHAYLPSGRCRHLYNLLIGVAVAQFLFAEAWINVGIVALLTRIVLAIVPRKMTGIVSFVLVMAFMVGTMAERLSCAWLSYKMDYTGAQMMATIKLTTFAFNYSDGKDSRSKEKRKNDLALAKTNFDKKNAEGDKRDPSALRRLKGTVQRLQTCWDTAPDLLTYFGWTYQFSGYPVGPAIELREYVRGCEDHPSNVSSALPATAKFVTGFLFLALFKTLGAFFPVGAAADWSCTFDGCTNVASNVPFGVLNLPGGSILSPKFAEAPFVHRLGYLFVAGFIVRVRYYFAWLTAEAAFNVAGFGYTPGSKSSAFFGAFKQWNGMANVDIYALETSTDMKLMRFWNFKTQRWLVSCVFKRVPSSTTVRTFATYFISALWHGIYPGYYACFIGAALITTFTNDFHRKLPGKGALFEDNASIVGFICKLFKWVITFMGMDFVVLGLLFLSIEHTYVAMRSVNFYMGPMVLAIAAVFKFVPNPKKKKA